MTCLSTLRETWPFSLCTKDDSDDEEWPPSWPKLDPTPTRGYAQTREMTAARRTFLITDPVSPAVPEQRQMHRIKTSRDRIPPIPTLPEQYYGLPADSRARSTSREPRKRSQSRNKLVKSRSQSASSIKSRPSIGTPSDFRKVAGASSKILRAEAMPRPRESWRRIPRGLSRRIAFRPLQLSIYEPGNELKPLPRFSRLILDPSRQSFLMEGNSRPLSPVPRVPSVHRFLPRPRSSRSKKTSRSPSRRVVTPKMPFASDSIDDAASDVSFDDLESVVDPDFNPTPIKNRARTQSVKANPHTLPSNLDQVRPPPPLKTRSLLPSPRGLKAPISPYSPRARNTNTFSIKLDDLPSAFSSPASPNMPILWPVPPGSYESPNGPIPRSAPEPAPSAYARIRIEREATPDQYTHKAPSQPALNGGDYRKRQSPTPSNGSSINTANSYSDHSSSTAPTDPPSPTHLKQSFIASQPPKLRPVSRRPVPAAPAPAHLREITVQRVVAEIPILQPVPRIPPKSPMRFMPAALDESVSRAQEAQAPRPEPRAQKQPAGDFDQPRQTQWPAIIQTAYAQYQQQQQEQLQQMEQLDMLRHPAQPPRPHGQAQAPPTTAPMTDTNSYSAYAAPKPVQPQRPQLHVQTSPAPQKQAPWPQQQQQQQQQQYQVQQLPLRQQQFQQPIQQQLPQQQQQFPPPLQQQLPHLQQQLQQQLQEQQFQQPLPQPQTSWAQTSSAWREVVWGMKRRTQEESVLQMHEQHVVIDAVSAHSEASEASRAPWAAQHKRGGSSEKGSGSSYGSSRSAVSRSSSSTSAETLAAADSGFESGRAAEASNAALLQMQPAVRHDMHAIAEESEEEDSAPVRRVHVAPKRAAAAARTFAAPAPPRTHTLSVVNGMPSNDTSEAESDSDSSSDDGASDAGSDDEGVWEMVESAPPSARQSLAVSRQRSTSANTAPPQQLRMPLTSRWSRSSSASPAPAPKPRSSSEPKRAELLPAAKPRDRAPSAAAAIAKAAARTRSQSREAEGARAQARARSSSSGRGSRSSSRSSRGSMYIPASSEIAQALAEEIVPPMPIVPANVPAPNKEMAQSLQGRKGSDGWGRGMGREFGVAY